MIYYMVIITCILSKSLAGSIQQRSSSAHQIETAISSNGGNFGGSQFDESSVTGGNEGKYASGAELTSLAHSSAIQAKTAVQNQHTAGSQAAFGAKSSLAQAALGAAATAQAALVGKQVIAQGLKKQLVEAQNQLQAEITQFHQTQTAAQAAQDAAQQAQNQLNSLTAAMASSQSSAQHAAVAAAESAESAASQHAMVTDAKQRVAQITERLHTSLSELAETESLAQKALAAAAIAQSNAAAAGAAVAVAAESNQHSTGHRQEGVGQVQLDYYN